MAAEHSFDIVSRVDIQEVSNAVNQAGKEISQRFDFKGSKSSIDLNRDKAEITVLSDDEHKLKSVIDILQGKLVKRGVALKSLDYGKVEQAAGDTVRQVVRLQQGIPTERAKELAKLVKDMKLKVQTEIQKDQLRVKGKNIDDLQSVIQALKERDFDFHMEFVNYR
ncbi:MAG: YajQ family cyclic di-GMP-binding protein [Nitrospirota bacterium]|jgi:uncharacterized protein YajQ (UPF0234 family)